MFYKLQKIYIAVLGMSYCILRRQKTYIRYHKKEKEFPGTQILYLQCTLFMFITTNPFNKEATLSQSSSQRRFGIILD